MKIKEFWWVDWSMKYKIQSNKIHGHSFWSILKCFDDFVVSHPLNVNDFISESSDISVCFVSNSSFSNFRKLEKTTKKITFFACRKFIAGSQVTFNHSSVYHARFVFHWFTFFVLFFFSKRIKNTHNIRDECVCVCSLLEFCNF